MRAQQNQTKFRVITQSGRILTVLVVGNKECSVSDIEADLQGEIKVEASTESAPPSVLSGYRSTPFRNTLLFVALWVIVGIIGFFAAMLIDLFIDMAKIGDGLTPERLRLLARGWLYLLVAGTFIYLAPALLRFRHKA
ncbi:hypothetical protein [Pseudomonas sp. RIT-PI-o]|uniref:hypothetical protein n=1 Tax=Pseudomonas sp. RIT-PI-o TaxID=1690246 RepID=UPI0006CE1210|nr:hypothetical protein [Pseudomonas sp. RIT-PI-o]KPG82248.1 hypothetical protein AEQ63_13690 [Pseudomonas sp. RIT-PI-o]